MSDLSPVRQLVDINNVVRLKNNSLFQSIAYVLLNHWDPLDISDSKGRNDVYSRFAPKVYSRELSARNTADLTQYLSFLSREVLGEKIISITTGVLQTLLCRSKNTISQILSRNN